MLAMAKIREGSNLNSRMGSTNFKFEEGVNIIVGDNGSGKSTLLQAIMATIAGTEKGLNLIRDPDVQVNLFSSEEMTRSMVKADASAEPSFLSNNNRSHGQLLFDTLKSIEGLGSNRVILIDEPEMALSIDNLGEVAKLIQQKAKEGVQFIISSHHPLVWTIAGANFVSMDGDKGYVKRIARMYVKRLNKL